MTYRVEPSPSVAAEVRQFSAPVLHYWKICLREIAADPHPRKGEFEERVIAFVPTPTRVRRFEIIEQASLSNETVYVLIADFFPYRVAYVLDADGLNAEVIFLRRSRKRMP